MRLQRGALIGTSGPRSGRAVDSARHEENVRQGHGTFSPMTTKLLTMAVSPALPVIRERLNVRF